MSVSIRQIHPVFVGEVSGVDISRSLAPDAVAALEAGMDRHAVLVFRDQTPTDEQQMAFSRNFGPLEDARGGNITKPEDRRLRVGMNDVSNLGRDGTPLERDSRQRLFNLGNMLWHSDSSFRPIPAKYSLLSARVVNPLGGNTEFADMRAAYDALDAATRAQIEDLARTIHGRPPTVGERWRRGAGGLQPFRWLRSCQVSRRTAPSLGGRPTAVSRGTAAGPPRPAASARPRAVDIRE
jgi:alpha-ketoglutarate-dependent taurine dioxygenase